MSGGESARISTKVMSLGEVSSENRYGLMIPTIQRDYKWGPGHDTDEKPNAAAYIFLEDMIDFFELRSEHDIYFTGTMIVFDEEGEPRTQLMDGQQRWTTVTALMGVIRYILRTTGGNNTETIQDIESRFLKLIDGSSFLNSRRKADKASIDFLVRELGPSKSLQLLPKTLVNNQTYKRENIQYVGTSLTCVIRYFYDKITKKFNITGGFSNTANLIKFYETIRDDVYINYSHTTSPTLAYKMFVTANGRGTPLNNFDVFRGLVLSRNRIMEFGDEIELQYVLDETDSILQELFDRKGIDTGKEIDKLMSQALTAYLTKKVSPHHVLSKLEHSISKFTTRKELDELVQYFDDYVTEYRDVLAQKGKIGRVAHLRLKSIGFSQHQQYYIAARVYWGKKELNVAHLVKIWENAVMRCLVLGDEGGMPKRVYAFEERHLGKIKAAKTNEEQIKAIKSMAMDFKNMKENPTNSTIMSKMLTRQFKASASDRNKIVAAFLALEPKYKNHEFKTTQGNPKISQFMPSYQWNNPETSFSYPDDNLEKLSVPMQIGNYFLIKETETYRSIGDWPKSKAKISIKIHNSGKSFATYQNIMNSDWQQDDIWARTKEIVAKLLEVYPEDCLPSSLK